MKEKRVLEAESTDDIAQQRSSGSTGASQSFKSVKIGNQVWMSENLNVDRFQNGELIPEAKTHEEWKKAGQNKQPAWCYYDFDSSNGAKYGKLYNWYAVNDPRGLAPDGWHVPSLSEWYILTNYLSGGNTEFNSETELKKLRVECVKKMQSPNGWARGFKYDVTNSSGFSALPGGQHDLHGFNNKLFRAYWWTLTEAYTTNANGFSLFGVEKRISSENLDKLYGLSVRCIKN